jgi:ketosteroid isomerase-like protein
VVAGRHGRGATCRGATTLHSPTPRSAGAGWGQVEEHLEQAASTAREGEPLRYESISEYSTGDLGYNLELEWTRAKFGGAEEMTPVSLRATTIFRREEGEWKIVHRHADPITTTHPAESVIQQ